MRDDVQQAKALLEVIPRAMVTIRLEMRRLAKGDLTVPQFRVIARLSRAESTNAEIAEWIGVSAAAMSKMVDMLVRRELVKRVPGTDRREVRLSLTPAGRRLFERLSGGVQKNVAERIARLSREQKDRLEVAVDVLKEVFI